MGEARGEAEENAPDGGRVGGGPVDVEVVDVRTAARLRADGALVVDVREHHEWRSGHLTDATHIPLGTLEEREGEMAGDRRIVVVCRSGQRSGAACAYLVSRGHDAVNLGGGLLAWEAAGLPLRAAHGGPGRVA